MKKYLVVFLSILIVFQTLVSVGVVVYYHLNKAFITQQLCENRSKPELKCNGHCYLSKQLKKAEEGEQKQMPNILKEKNEVISSTPDELPGIYYPAYTISTLPVLADSHYPASNTNELIKPPVA